MDGAIDFETAQRAEREFDRVPADVWHTYSGHDEAGKRACRDWPAIEQYAPACHAILRFLVSATAARLARELTGLECLLPDTTLYGGGLHAMPAGSRLGLHLDNEIHPETGHLRSLNAILFLGCLDPFNESFETHGGHLELWPRDRISPAVRIAPAIGRLVLMETGPYSYHSVAPIEACAKERRSIAAYFWRPPRARARFLSQAGAETNAEIEAARIARSR